MNKTVIIHARIHRADGTTFEAPYFGRGANWREIFANVSQQVKRESPDAAWIEPLKVVPVKGQCPNCGGVVREASVWDRVGVIAKGVG